MLKPLMTSPLFPRPSGPLVLVVMDGIGVAPDGPGNAVAQAHTPTLDRLFKASSHLLLKAHGTAVGLPSDKDMGNSEVGHNALGAGRVYDQGAKLVNEAIESGALFRGKTWSDIISAASKGGALHLIGLLSDGNVHSHIQQLFALIREAARSGVERLFLHPLLDGRDVPETSALVYMDQAEELLASLHSPPKRIFRIASGGGRMVVTMDRYGADWTIVERGWKAHVLGQGRAFPSARQAIETLRKEQEGVIDQFLPAFVVHDESGPIGTIQDGDAVVFFNFRGDRAIEISKAFEDESFDKFQRQRWPRVFYAGMMLYDGDLQIPKRYLVPPPHISETMGEYLASSGFRQLACAETQKFGHVTYFWNGNRSGKFSEELETYIEVPSDRVPFEQRPWMKAAEVTDAFINELKARPYDFARLNYANGDMVGHTGVLDAARLAVESVDLCLHRILKAVFELDGLVLVTADHGNADEMYELDPKTRRPILDENGELRPKTSHTLSPVPLILVSPKSSRPGISFDRHGSMPGLANVASTALELMGLRPPDAFLPSLLARP